MVSKIWCVEKCAAFLVNPVLSRIISFGKKNFGRNLFLPERFELQTFRLTAQNCYDLYDQQLINFSRHRGRAGQVHL